MNALILAVAVVAVAVTVWFGIRILAAVDVAAERVGLLEQRLAEQQRTLAELQTGLGESTANVGDVRHLLIYGELPTSDEPTPALVRLLSWASGMRRTGQVLFGGTGGDTDE
ncbi:MAG: hypothetical protein KDB86_03015 [Actinobacteria bacterium]|nr:hypothetical protein [Actinomycetota bacterium]